MDTHIKQRVRRAEKWLKIKLRMLPEYSFDLMFYCAVDPSESRVTGLCHAGIPEPGCTQITLVNYSNDLAECRQVSSARNETIQRKKKSSSTPTGKQGPGCVLYYHSSLSFVCSYFNHLSHSLSLPYHTKQLWIIDKGVTLSSLEIMETDVNLRCHLKWLQELMGVSLLFFYYVYFCERAPQNLVK